MDEILYKILLLGDSDVGKSSLMIRFTDNFFEENNVSTIGIVSKRKKIKINNRKINLDIYDTSGQERYHSIAKNYIYNSNGIIFVFDLNKEKTFKSITNWLTTCDDIIKDYPKILVGNKLDLEDREIDAKIAEELCEKHKMKYYETSAKKDINVNKIFYEIARLILDSKQKEEKEKEKGNELKIQNTIITIKNNEVKKEKKCC